MNKAKIVETIPELASPPNAHPDFVPKITITTRPGADKIVRECRCWHLPNGSTTVSGLVSNMPPEVAKEKYAAFLLKDHDCRVVVEDVKVISSPEAAPQNGKTHKPKSKKILKAATPESGDLPVVVEPIAIAEAPAKLSLADYPTGLPERFQPPEEAVAVPGPAIEVSATKSDEVKPNRTSEMPRQAPFFEGSRKNPYYETIVFAALMNWDEPACISESQWDRRMKDSLEILQEVVPKAGDWNRASVDADEIVKQWLPCLRNFELNEVERRKLWEIVQGRIYKILTEQRAQRESEVKAARRK